MTPATLKALRGSIAKWKAIEEGTGTDRGANNCPLCDMFFEDISSRCQDCPVAEKTGETECRGTPYIPWRDLFQRSEWPFYANTPARIAAARKFRLWLERLLPEGRKK